MDYVRKFKGARSVPAASAPKKIDLAADPAVEWADVGPEFIAYPHNTGDRDAAAYGGVRLTDTSGRNDFVGLKAARDGENYYFLAECAEDITKSKLSHSGQNRRRTLHRERIRNGGGGRGRI